MLRRKPHFDARVATALGINRKLAAKVTRAFLLELVASFGDLDEIQLDGFGKFKIRVRKHPVTVRLPPKRSQPKIEGKRLILRQYRVYFQKARTVSELFRNKYGPSIEDK